MNEAGTEAAAATGIGLNEESARITPSFKADKPFIYLIKDNKTNTILFMGRMMKPTE